MPSESPRSKHIMTMDELCAFKKSMNEGTGFNRPDANVASNGDLERPSFEKITKNASSAPRVKMGVGVNPHDVVAADWEDYDRYVKGLMI